MGLNGAGGKGQSQTQKFGKIGSTTSLPSLVTPNPKPNPDSASPSPQINPNGSVTTVGLGVVEDV